jgi:hypothetical protein
MLIFCIILVSSVTLDVDSCASSPGIIRCVQNTEVAFLVHLCRCIEPGFLRPEPWPPLLFSLILLYVCIATQIADFYWSEKSFPSLFNFHWRYTQQGLRDALCHTGVV